MDEIKRNKSVIFKEWRIEMEYYEELLHWINIIGKIIIKRTKRKEKKEEQVTRRSKPCRTMN